MSFTIITYTMGETVKRHTSASEVETDETVQEIENSGGTVIDITESGMYDEPEPAYNPYAFDPRTATSEQWDEYLLHEPQEDPEQEAHVNAELARGELAFQPHELDCPYHGQKSDVVKLGKIVDRVDPTQTYVLACGHTVL